MDQPEWRQGSHGLQAFTVTAMHVTAWRCTAVLGCQDTQSPATLALLVCSFTLLHFYFSVTFLLD